VGAVLRLPLGFPLTDVAGLSKVRKNRSAPCFTAFGAFGTRVQNFFFSLFSYGFSASSLTRVMAAFKCAGSTNLTAVRHLRFSASDFFPGCPFVPVPLEVPSPAGEPVHGW